MADLMAVDREINHYIVGNNIEEVFEQESNKRNIHRMHDNAHHGQGVHSVRTSFVTRRFLGLSIIGWVTSKVSRFRTIVLPLLGDISSSNR